VTETLTAAAHQDEQRHAWIRRCSVACGACRRPRPRPSP